MTKSERKNTILQFLRKTMFSTVEEIARETGASTATVRRDLALLEEEGEIIRLNGGAALSHSGNNLMYLEDASGLIGRLDEQTEEKKRIAREAASKVRPDSTIYIDGGSTGWYFMDCLRETNIRLATGNLYVAMNAVKNHIRTFLLGGEVNHIGMNALSYATAERVRRMNFDIAFLGTRALDPVRGVSSTQEWDALEKRAILERSKEVYIMADHTKFGQSRLFAYGALKEFTLITDDNPVWEDYPERIIRV